MQGLCTGCYALHNAAISDATQALASGLVHLARNSCVCTDAGIVQGLAEGIAKVAPDAWVAIISNPVNSTVPIVAEVFKRTGGPTACRPCLWRRCSHRQWLSTCTSYHFDAAAAFTHAASRLAGLQSPMSCQSQAHEAGATGTGTYDPKKVLGVTKLDVVRAKAFIGQITGTDPKEVAIPVVGGHAGTTILPLLSQVGFQGLVLGSSAIEEPPVIWDFPVHLWCSWLQTATLYHQQQSQSTAES